MLALAAVAPAQTKFPAPFNAGKPDEQHIL
jgi:hypothetical protein